MINSLGQNYFVVFLSKNCYEILLIALLFHLYRSVFFQDIYFYGTYIRAANTIFMYITATNIFFQRDSRVSKANGIIVLSTLFANLILLYFNDVIFLNEFRNISFLLFLFLILYNISVFLVSPHRFDSALISASIIGYLLIIEIATRIFIILYQVNNNQVLSNIDYGYHTKTFVDTVYYCTVTITSIGFGDILPINRSARMVTSILGLSGQFYLVITMSLMISKFVSKRSQNE